MNSFRLNKKNIAMLIATGTIFSSGAQDKVANDTIAKSSDSAKIVKIDEIMRQQYELEADLLFKESNQLIAEQKFEEASGKLEKVIFQLGNVSKSDPKILKKAESAKQLHGVALKGFALQLISEANKNQNENTQVGFQKALTLLNKAKKLSTGNAELIDDEIDKVKKLISINEHIEKVGAYRLNEEFINDPQKGSIANKILFDRAKILFAQRRFTKCRTNLEQILVNQPYNESAVNLLYRTNKKILEAGLQRRENAYQEYLDEVEWKWSDPINIYSNDSVLKSDVKSVDANTQVGKIYRKLQIVIPKVRFDNRDLDFVVDFIKRTTRDLDEEGEGLNVIVSVDGGNSPAPAAVEDDPLGGDDLGLDDPEVASVADSGGKKINLDADDIPVGEVIKYICEQVGLKYKVEEFAVIIGDSASFQTLETKFYSISAGLLDIVETKQSLDLVGGLGDTGTPDDGNKFKSYFESLGITFPPGAKMKFVAGAMRLVVTNTPINHRKLDEVLRQIGIETPQVSIEAKFIEIQHTNVEEFGFEWLIGRPNHIDHQPNGINHQNIGATDGTAPNFDNPNQGLAPNSASGIRGINDIINPDFSSGQAAVSLIMGDYIFQGLVRALEQESTSDTLSAPQVTAVSGKTAIIRVVDEMYFPESFEPPEISVDAIVGSAPTYGEPRDVGIVLEVTPTVEPDGYTISLDLRPQVLEFLEFDTAFNDEVEVALLAGQAIPVIYSMPILVARTIETRVTIWDGETIMLGGLINERVTSVTDKVPYLSDIPLLGELFQSSGSQSEKVNLLVFVTARLIDPAGLPKKPSVDKGLPDFKRL